MPIQTTPTTSLTSILVASVVTASCFLPSHATASTIHAATPSYGDVRSAVDAANSGDTVVVPEGTAVWSRRLDIVKRVILQGAGRERTVIVGAVGPSEYILSYKPSDAFSTAPFRMTGFTFDGSDGSRILTVSRTTVDRTTYLRLDHNRFIAPKLSAGPALLFIGTIYGVIDSNVFENAAHIDNYGLNIDSWTASAYIPGTADNLYYEDNVFNLCFTADTAGHGGRYVKRYNTYALTDPRQCYGHLSGFYPLFDAHGNQPSGVYASMGIEIYGNAIHSAYNIYPFLDHRGGKAFVFSNKVVGAPATIRVREEYADSISPPVMNRFDESPQRPNNSYYWNNRMGPSGTQLFEARAGEGVVDNQDFFNCNQSFDGTVGFGCGPLSERPLSCAPGTAYWATTQSQSTLDDRHVGPSPSIPIAGTLYRCTAQRIWREFFTPYIYPHPFRSGLVAPIGLKIVPG